jgi:hypothetical protein
MKLTTSKSELRSFGLVIAGGFAVMALAPLVFRHQHPRQWALVVALAAFILAWTAPGILLPVHRSWMAVGECLAWLNTRIILTIVYFILIVPIGAILRIAGKDPMLRKFAPEDATYREGRAKRPASHMQHQY